ncbi:MAG: hypothetical protein AAFR00_10800 [Pseudomonadota bacterium]
MVSEASLLRLFARCPVWLWPVLALSLVSLREQVRLLAELGATGVDLHVTPWGRAHVANAWWLDGPIPWKDLVYRTAMGEPVAAPAWSPEPLGILTDETQVAWVLSRVGRDDIPPPAAGNDTTARRHTTAGGTLSRPTQDLARAPPLAAPSNNTFRPPQTALAPAPADACAGAGTLGARDADNPGPAPCLAVSPGGLAWPGARREYRG